MDKSVRYIFCLLISSLTFRGILLCIMFFLANESVMFAFAEEAENQNRKPNVASPLWGDRRGDSVSEANRKTKSSVNEVNTSSLRESSAFLRNPASRDVSPLNLSIQECISLALKSNLNIRIKRIGPQIQDALLTMAKGRFDPSATFSPSANSAEEPSSTPGITGAEVRSSNS